jgi:hypothetical protein
MGASSTTPLYKSPWTYVLTGLAAIYIALNLFVVGGDAFIINLNNYLSVPLSIGVTLAAYWFTRRSGGSRRTRTIWWGLTIGWGLWAVAQVWWAVAAMLTGEVPYPSVADFLFIVGYLPIYVAVWLQMRSLPPYTTTLQRALLWVAVLMVVVFTGWFVLLPTIQSNDPGDRLTSLLNTLYPLLDLVLLVIVLRIFFSYQQGRYARAWLWISTGFILQTFSDFYFVYLVSQELYYPDGVVNLASTVLVDIPYNLSYLVWIIGLLALQRISQTGVEVKESRLDLELVPNTHLYFLTRPDNTILHTSQNVEALLPLDAVIGKTFSQALGFSPEQTTRMLAAIQVDRFLKEGPAPVDLPWGGRKALVSGMRIDDESGAYAGVFVLVRALLESYSYDEMLTPYDREIVKSILRQTGVEQIQEGEVRRLLTTYYRGFLHGFARRLHSEGGGIMVDSFLAELQALAAKNGWAVRLPAGDLLDTSAVPLADLRRALPVLLDAARAFVSKTIDAATAEAIVGEVKAQVGGPVRRNIEYWEAAAV